MKTETCYFCGTVLNEDGGAFVCDECGAAWFPSGELIQPPPIEWRDAHGFTAWTDGRRMVYVPALGRVPAGFRKSKEVPAASFQIPPVSVGAEYVPDVDTMYEDACADACGLTNEPPDFAY